MRDGQILSLPAGSGEHGATRRFAFLRTHGREFVFHRGDFFSAPLFRDQVSAWLKCGPFQSFYRFGFLESGWTLFPLLLSLALFGWGAAAYYHMERPPGDALQVQVVGKQWMWKLQHAEGKKEINELHVPLGRAVTLTLTSQDVIHSFYIPAFRVKQDAVPGRYTAEWFQPTRLGEYHLFCAEYCGTDHSGMIGRIVVMEPAEYQRWLTSGERTEAVALAGERLFHDRGCSGCHSENSQFHAPLLEGVYGKPVPLASGETVTADDRYIRDSILLPAKQISAGYENIMPSYSGQLGEEEIMQLIAYLKSIGDQPKPNEPR